MKSCMYQHWLFFREEKVLQEQICVDRTEDQNIFTGSRCNPRIKEMLVFVRWIQYCQANEPGSKAVRSRIWAKMLTGYEIKSKIRPEFRPYCITEL